MKVKYFYFSVLVGMCILMFSCKDEWDYPAPLDTPSYLTIDVDASAKTTMIVSWDVARRHDSYDYSSVLFDPGEPVKEGVAGYYFTLEKVLRTVDFHPVTGLPIVTTDYQVVDDFSRKFTPTNSIVCPQEPGTEYRFTLRAAGDGKKRSDAQRDQFAWWDNLPVATPHPVFGVTYDYNSDKDFIYIMWRNVPGSIGVEFSLYEVDANGDNPEPIGEVKELAQPERIPYIVDGEHLHIDGYPVYIVSDWTIVVREQSPGMYFMMELQALADPNPKHNKLDGEFITHFFDNFPGELLPSGSDLTEYFTQKPPEGEVDFILTLENDGIYSMTGDIKLGITPIRIRSQYTDQTTRAIIHVTDGSFINAGAGFILENVELNYDNYSETGLTSKAVILMDINYDHIGRPTATAGSARGYIFVHTAKPIGFQSVKITGLKTHLLYNPNTCLYAIGTFFIDDCVIGMNTSSMAQALIRFDDHGAIKNLSITNSTFYNISTGATSNNRFIRFGGTLRLEQVVSPPELDDVWFDSSIADNPRGAAGNMLIKNCTFWQFGKYSQSFNSNGPFRSAASHDLRTIENNVFVDSFENADNIINRFSPHVRENNSVWFEGVRRGGDIAEEPELVHLGDGVFTMNNAENIAAGVGDPRWLP